MQRILITGVSGTGKTTILKELNKRGIHAVGLDEDPGLCDWINKETGKTVEYEAVLDKDFIDKHDWVCDVSLLEKFMKKNVETMVFLGAPSNQNDLLDKFDKVLLLQCRPETFIERINSRDDNDFGKEKSAQEVILSWYKNFEDDLLKKGAISINVDRPLRTVVDEIVAHIE